MACLLTRCLHESADTYQQLGWLAFSWPCALPNNCAMRSACTLCRCGNA